MALTRLDLVGDGTTTVYDVTFSLGYLREEFVYVYLEGSTYTDQLNYSWLNDTQIQLNSAPTNGQEFHIRRVVPRGEAVNDYQSGAILREQNLDDSFLQGLMIQEEITDGYLVVDGEIVFLDNLDMMGNRVTNMGDPVDPLDAVNKQTFDNEQSARDSVDYVQDERLNDLEGSIVTSGTLTYKRTTWTASQGQTEFTTTVPFGGIHSLFINGIHQISGESYESVGTTLISTIPLNEGDRVVAILGQEIEFLEPDQVDLRYTRYNWFATGGEVSLTLPIPFIQVMALYINGIHQTYLNAFSYDNLDTVFFAEALDAGDEVVFVLGNEPEEFVGLTVAESDAAIQAAVDLLQITIDDLEGRIVALENP